MESNQHLGCALVRGSQLTSFKFAPSTDFYCNVVLVGGHTSIVRLPREKVTFWWIRLESNQRHPDLQSGALPSELRVHYLVSRVGFEPTTCGLKVRYSIQLSYRLKSNIRSLSLGQWRMKETVILAV